MSVVVRGHDPEGSVSMIQSALGATDGIVGESACVVVGDVISMDEQDGFLRGHGTRVVDGKLVATLCGVVQRVNKLVYVKPLKSRYGAEQGDIVIGRVTEVSGKRWKVRQDCFR
ncbi:hypothetical protein FOA52_004614 [Chlamydomonas sp. UWO 241]|nr:hypothetical protein FOA52_004614 [Chlamydomonas sp. UWO 241]